MPELQVLSMILERQLQQAEKEFADAKIRLIWILMLEDLLLFQTKLLQTSKSI
jgi:orotate phosphoribosyltransferase